MADSYFNACAERGSRPTITGLACAVALSSRIALDGYARREEFAEAVARAKCVVEAAYEEALFGERPTGAIFVLKHGFGWQDTPRANAKMALGVGEGLRTLFSRID